MAGPISNKKLEDKKEMSEEIKATTAKPAGADAVVLLAEKLEGVIATLNKFEERFKKEEEVKMKCKEEERKKEEEEEAKKKEAVLTKLEGLSTAVSKLEEMVKVKKDETSSGIPKDVPKTKFEKAKPKPEEEEEEEEEEKKFPPEKKEMKGAKIESPDEVKTEVTAEVIPLWFKEIRAFAEKKGILD